MLNSPYNQVGIINFSVLTLSIDNGSVEPYAPTFETSVGPHPLGMFQRSIFPHRVKERAAGGYVGIHLRAPLRTHAGYARAINDAVRHPTVARCAVWFVHGSYPFPSSMRPEDGQFLVSTPARP